MHYLFTEVWEILDRTCCLRNAYLSVLVILQQPQSIRSGLPLDSHECNYSAPDLQVISVRKILKNKSRRALLYRLKNLKLISSGEYEAYAIHVKRGALQNGYFTDLYEPGNDKVVIGDYGSVARSLFDKENISESHYYSLLAELGIDVTKIDDATDAED